MISTLRSDNPQHIGPERSQRSWQWRPRHTMRRSALRAGILSLLVLLPALPHLSVAAAQTTAPKAYIGLFKDNAVAVLDTHTQRVLSIIPVPPGPHGLVVTPDGRKVYLSSDGASAVSVIDTATDRIVRSIDVGPTPHGLAISPDGHQVVVSGWGANRVSVIDTTTDSIVGSVSVPQPHNSVISRDGRTAYVGSQQQGATAIVMVDLVQQTQVGTIPLDKTPRALDLSVDGTQLYVTVAGMDAVQVLDIASKRVMDPISVGISPHQPLIPPAGPVGLVVSQGTGTLELLDLPRHAVSSTVQVGKAPHWIAISSDGATAYVTNEGSNDVSIVDLARRTVATTIAVGNAPRKIAVQPGPGATASAPLPAPTRTETGVGQAAQSAKPPLTPQNLAFSDHGTREVKGQTELELEADDYYFAPTFLRGEPGQKLKLAIDNESGMLHNLSIPAQGIDQDVPPKGKVEVEITFPQSGVVPFFCKFHAALGMRGEFLVGDAAQHTLSHGVTLGTR
jgi:YVTN family beta-propeller protein